MPAPNNDPSAGAKTESEQIHPVISTSFPDPQGNFNPQN
jgi:hypothetical protein